METKYRIVSRMYSYTKVKYKAQYRMLWLFWVNCYPEVEYFYSEDSALAAVENHKIKVRYIK